MEESLADKVSPLNSRNRCIGDGVFPHLLVVADFNCNALSMADTGGNRSGERATTTKESAIRSGDGRPVSVPVSNNEVRNPVCPLAFDPARRVMER